MKHRNVLELAGWKGLLFSVDAFHIRRALWRMMSPFRRAPAAVAESDRQPAALPEGGRAVSVEKALNSRCTADGDGNPRQFHWGMWDPARRLTEHQIAEVVGLARRTPGFTEGAEIEPSGDVLEFTIPTPPPGAQRDGLMVSSGMQQQAVCLVCAALGIGVVFQSRGDDGSALSPSLWSNTRLRLGAMLPGYDGAFWTSAAPAGPRPWANGNLPPPVRDGARPLLEVLDGLRLHQPDGVACSSRGLSQLLWAGRGRTPHFYKSQPWGLTIPTSRGDQDVSRLYVLAGQHLSLYLNWRGNRPTHALEPVAAIDAATRRRLAGTLPAAGPCIVMAAQEAAGRARWEVGCAVLNLMLQAAALGLRYDALLLDARQKDAFRAAGIQEPLAAFLLHSASPNPS